MMLLDWLRGVLLGAKMEDLDVKEISAVAELDAVFAESEATPLFLFKHSTTCPISAAAYRRVAEYLAVADGAPVYLVKVIEARPVSNEIAARTGVRHESPQCVLLDHGAAVWHASHGGVTAAAMSAAVLKTA